MRNLFFARQRDQQPLRPPADGARDVQIGVQARAARQNEAAQRGQVLIHRVDFALQLRRLRPRDASLLRMNILRLGREYRAEVEQLMLDAPHDAGEQSGARIDAGRFIAGNLSEPEERVQLVDGAISFDAQRILGDALPAGEPGLSLVAGLGVNAIERKARIIEGFLVHAVMVVEASRCDASSIPFHLAKGSHLEEHRRGIADRESLSPCRDLREPTVVLLSDFVEAASRKKKLV